MDDPLVAQINKLSHPNRSSKCINQHKKVTVESFKVVKFFKTATFFSFIFDSFLTLTMAKATQKSNNKVNKKPINKKAGNTKTAKAVKKAVQAKDKLEDGVDGVIEYEDLGNIDTWDWNEASGTDMFLGDDAGGFLCLEEISDVEVEYEGDEVSGKVAKFKVCDSLGQKSQAYDCTYILSLIAESQEAEP